MRRTRLIATALLVAMLALFALTATDRAASSWLGWVHAFAEAAAVGALADWFAVTALFRHPLGLPIPHTAIIPRNKDEIGRNLGEFVEQNFLTPENVIRKLEQRNLALAGAQWLKQPAHSQQIAARICAHVPRLIERFADADVQRALARVIEPQLDRLDLARIAGEVLDMVVGAGRHQSLLDQGLAALDGWLDANRALIKAKISEGSKYTLAMFDAYLANRLVDGVLALLHEVADDPQHEVRSRFHAATQAFIRELKTSAEYRERGEAFKRELFAHLRLESHWEQLAAELKRRLLADLAADHSLLREHIVAAVTAMAEEICEDPALQRKLNGWTLQALESLMLRHRQQVSLLIAEVVRSWDAREVTERIEMEIGRDLQFIRINGTLVGGSAGLLLHAATSAAQHL